MFYPVLQQTIDKFRGLQGNIPEERKALLDQVVTQLKTRSNEPEVNIQFICTHNSRRSVFAQVWGQIMAYNFRLKNIHCFSGGTEETAIYPAVIETLTQQGIHIMRKEDGQNPHYEVFYNGDSHPMTVFSKVYSHSTNPNRFIAIMTCSDAAENCPFIPQAELRLSLTYEDPKAYDQHMDKKMKYLERSQQIGTELYYIFNELAI